MVGLLAYGAYVPHNRLRAADIAAVLGGTAAKGQRAVASFDEDSTSMAVEAARQAVPLRRRNSVRQLLFATASPAYLDKTNAAAVHAALGLDRSALAVDLIGSVRSGVGALLSAAATGEPTLVALADVRGGLPGGADERSGGDGAAAFVLGNPTETEPLIAELLATASTTDEFLDRWRAPGEFASRQWEDRFGEEVYLPLAQESFENALRCAGLASSQIDHLVVAGLHRRAVQAFSARCGVPKQALADPLTDTIGNAGVAQFGLVLADVLDKAAAEEIVVVTVLGDGASTLVLRTTGALTSRRSPQPVAAQIARGTDTLTYATYLSWRGLLSKEPPRRPEPEPVYAPPSHRRVAWKFGFVASRCDACATRLLPPTHVCWNCGAIDRTVPEPMAEVPGVVATYTVDRLVHTPDPPMIVAVVDFDGGGRFRFQLTDCRPAEIDIGVRVVPTFRRVSTSRGIHNYFWKARPLRALSEEQR